MNVEVQGSRSTVDLYWSGFFSHVVFLCTQRCDLIAPLSQTLCVACACVCAVGYAGHTGDAGGTCQTKCSHGTRSAGLAGKITCHRSESVSATVRAPKIASY